jgi:P pilus assembly chaperone PapD
MKLPNHFDLFRPARIAGRVLTLAAALCGALPAPVQAQVGLGLSPMRLELKMRPGSQYSGALTITNDSKDKLRIRAEILDFYIDQQETPQFARNYPQEAEYSCRAWLTVNPMETELAAGSSALIRYTLRFPDFAPTDRGYHCAAGFTTLPSAEAQAQGMGVKTAVRMVAAFYVIAGQPVLEGEMKEIKLEQVVDPKTKTGSWRAVVVMENGSDLHYRPVGEVQLIDASGKVLEKKNFSSLPVLPKRSQRFLFPLENKLSAGPYTLKARVDIGGKSVQEATAVVEPVNQP